MQVMRIKIMVIISLVIIIINKSENVNYNSSIKSYQELLLSKKEKTITIIKFIISKIFLLLLHFVC